MIYVEIVLPGRVAERPALLNSFNVAQGFSIAFDAINAFLTYTVLREHSGARPLAADEKEIAKADPLAEP